MNDGFRPAADSAEAPPATGSRYLDPTEVEWQATGTEGFWLKPLLEDSAGGLSSALMKIDPGAFSPLHAHESLEQILVLEGSFYDHDRRIEAGSYVVRAPGAMHTAGSEEGALVLLIFSRTG